MKKFLLLTVAALGIFVACEKDEFEALDEAFALEVARLDAADDVLQSNIDDLKAEFDAFVIAINEKIDAAVAALEAADDALEAYINAEIADLSARLEAAVDSLTASINDNTDLIKETGKELRKKIAEEAVARAAGDLALANELADQVNKLEKQDSIAASHINRNLGHIFRLGSAIQRESAARVAADADLQGQINTVSSTLVSAVARIDAAANLASLALLAEVQARQNGDNGLQGSIDANSGLIQSLTSSLTTAQGNLASLTTRIQTVEGWNSRITALEDYDHAADLEALRLRVQTYAETHANTEDDNHARDINAEIDRIERLVLANAGSITDINAQLGTISSTLARLSSGIDNANANHNTLTGFVSSLQTRLEGLIGANASQADLDSLAARVAAVELYGPQITALETRIDVLEAADVVIGSELVTAIGGLRTELQSYADDNDADTVFDGTALQASIDALTARIDALPTTGGGSGNGVAITWTPAFGTQTADFTQTGNLDGAELTRLVSVSASAPVISGGSTSTLSNSFTSNGSDLTQTTYAEVQAAVTQPGTYVIVETINEEFSGSISTVTWSATANGAPYGSHDVVTNIPAVQSTRTVNHPDIVNVADAADEIVATPGAPVRSGGVSSTVNDGAPVITYENDGATDQFRTEVSTQATLDQTTAVVETTVTTYAVRVNGVEDTPALVAPSATTSVVTISEATSVAGTPIVTRTIETTQNPAYQAPNGADVWRVAIGESTGGEISNLRDGTIASQYFLVNGGSTQYPSLAAAQLAIPFGTSENISEVTVYNQIHDVAATFQVERLTVVDAPDVAGTATGNTRQGSQLTTAQVGVDAGTTRVETGTGSSYPSTAVAANGPDTWAVTGTYGGGVTEGSTYEVIVSTATAGSDVASVTQTYDIRRMDTTAASGNIETYAVVDADDDLTDNIVDGSTREVQLVAESTSEVVVTAGLTREVANSAYRAPSSGPSADVTFTVTTFTSAATAFVYSYSLNGGTAVTFSANDTVSVSAGDSLVINYGVGGTQTRTINITAADIASGSITIDIHQFTGPAKS